VWRKSDRLKDLTVLSLGFQCMYEDNSGAGIMCLKLIGNRLVTARINGTLDFLEVESTLHGQAGDNLSSLSHRCKSHNFISSY